MPNTVEDRCLTPPAAGHRAAGLPGEVCLAAFAAVAVLLFLTVGMDRPVWLDEANPALWARLNFTGLIDALRRDNSLPAYYVLLFFWVRLFGDSEVALRALSALFYLAAAGVTGLLGWTLWRDRRAALYATVFYLASAQAIRQAQLARMYSMLGLLAALSLLLFVRVFVESRGGRGYIAAYWIVNSIGAVTQVWFFFLLFGELAYQFLWLRRDRLRFVVYLAIPASVFAALWGPIFLQQLRNGSTGWLPSSRPWFLADAIIRFYGGDLVSVVFLGLCAVPLLLARRTARAGFWHDPGTRLVSTVFPACLVLPLLITLVKPIYYPGRYTTIALPALAAFLAAVMLRLAPRAFALGVCYLILIAAAFWHIGNRGTVGDDPRPGQSDRASAEYIVRKAAPGDVLAFTSLTRPAADYYMRRLGAEGRFVEASFPSELDRHPGFPENSAGLADSPVLAAEAGRIAQMARDRKRIWLYYGFDLDVARVLKQTLDRSLVLVDQADLRGPFHEKLLVYARPGRAEP